MTPSSFVVDKGLVEGCQFLCYTVKKKKFNYTIVYRSKFDHFDFMM